MTRLIAIALFALFAFTSPAHAAFSCENGKNGDAYYPPNQLMWICTETDHTAMQYSYGIPVWTNELPRNGSPAWIVHMVCNPLASDLAPSMASNGKMEQKTLNVPPQVQMFRGFVNGYPRVSIENSTTNVSCTGPKAPIDPGTQLAWVWVWILNPPYGWADTSCGLASPSFADQWCAGQLFPAGW
jgi:hypothetical protein